MLRAGFGPQYHKGKHHQAAMDFGHKQGLPFFWVPSMRYRRVSHAGFAEGCSSGATNG